MGERLGEQDGLVTDHPYQPSVWPDTCGYEDSGPPPLMCGYSAAEHSDRHIPESA